MSKVRTSLAYSVVSKYLIRLINLSSVIFIARMLSPEQLGIFAIASALVLIASELKSFGADGYLIREKEIDRSTVAKALGVSTMISWSIGTAVFLGSWAIESFYQQPDIALLIQLLSLSFFLSPHIGIGKSLLARDFKFDRIFVIEAGAQTTQFLAVIAFVLMDFGYFALAFSNMIGFSMELALVVLFRSKLYSFKPVWKDITVIAKFGVFVSFGNLLRKMSMSMPELIIGKLGTPTEVAYFSRGTGFLNFLSMTINSGIRPVVAPYLADKQRKGFALSEPYLYASKMICGLMIPVLAVAGYASDVVIVAMFGEQWLASAPLVTILCFAAIIRTMVNMSISVFVTAGHEKALFYLDLFLFALTVVLIAFLYPMGLSAVAYGFVIVAVFRFTLTSLMLRKLFDIALHKQLTNHISNFLIAGVCVGVLALVEQFVGIPSVYGEVFFVGAVAGLCWVCSIFLFRHPLSEEVKKVASAIKTKLGRTPA